MTGGTSTTGQPAQAEAGRAPTRLSTARKLGYIAMSILIGAVIVLTIAQPILFAMVPNPRAYASVPAGPQGGPQEDKRGAFLMLYPTGEIEERFQSTLIELLAVNRAGVVDELSGVHLKPADISGIMVQSASVGEPYDYRVYRLDGAQVPLKHARQPGGRRMLMQLAAGAWEPGGYVLDVPAEGMFGGRIFYQFYVDAPQE